MTDSHQECIAEGVFDGVVEFGKHRINIQKYHHIKDTKCKENDIQNLRHCSADISLLWIISGGGNFRLFAGRGWGSRKATPMNSLPEIFL